MCFITDPDASVMMRLKPQDKTLFLQQNVTEMFNTRTVTWCWRAWGSTCRYFYIPASAHQLVNPGRWMYKQENSNGEWVLHVCFALELKPLYKPSSGVISFGAVFSSEPMIYWRRRLSRCHVSSGLLLQAPRNHSCFILFINHIIWNHLCTVHILGFSAKNPKAED